MTSAPTGSAPRRPATILVAGAVAVLVLAPLTFYLTEPMSAPAIWPRWIAIMALAWWLPGALIIANWSPPKLEHAEALLFAVGAGLCWLVLVAMLLHWVPGPIKLWPMVAAYESGLFVLLAWQWRRPAPKLRPTSIDDWLRIVLVPLVVASLLRLPGLGYHEFHIDEVLVLTRANEAIRGQDDAFARHTKGSGELAIAGVLYRALGSANETTARLPFALAGVGSVVALALLGRRLFSTRTGFWAALLFAVNGFALGLSRIVQYQPAVLLLLILTLLAARRFARHPDPRWLASAGTLGAFGITFHYEFGLILPAVLLMTVIGYRKHDDKRPLAITMVRTGLLGTTLVALTYIPTYLHPYFDRVQEYLGVRSGRLFGNFNLAFFVEMATFYNATYFIAGLVTLAAFGISLGLQQNRGRYAQATWMLIIWFVPYLILYIFVIQFPGTHFYLLMPAWSLLAAVVLARFTGPHQTDPTRRWVVTVISILWLLISANYLYLMFFRQDPEYLVNYAAEREPFYWAPYGKDIPDKPRFGFPILEGWKTLGVLSEWGYLNGTYTSNEHSRFLRWYLGDFEYVNPNENPEFVFIAEHVQENDPLFDDDMLDSYIRFGEVRVRGEPRIALWAQTPPTAVYAIYDLENFVGIFDGLAPTFEEWSEPQATLTDHTLSPERTLLQAGVDRREAKPGNVLHLLLRWRIDEQLDRDYRIFVHVADAERRPIAQWDGLPGLNSERTSQQQAGEIFDDHILLPLPDDIPPGEYTLLTGLYDPESGERLGDNVVEIDTLVVH